MVDVRQPDAGDSLSASEVDLYRRINAYRVSLGLGQLRLSKALTTTANRHLLDLSSRGAFEHGWAANVGFDQCNASHVLGGYRRRQSRSTLSNDAPHQRSAPSAFPHLPL